MQHPKTKIQIGCLESGMENLHTRQSQNPESTSSCFGRFFLEVILYIVFPGIILSPRQYSIVFVVFFLISKMDHHFFTVIFFKK